MRNKVEAIKRIANNERLEDYVGKRVIICGDTVIVKATKRKRCNTNNNKNCCNDDKRANTSKNQNKSKNRVANERTLLNSLQTARRLILNNFSGNENEAFITLTYCKPEFDVKKLQEDFKAFWRKFKRKYPHCEYLRIAEPSNIGNWHLHILVKDVKNEKLIIDNAELRNLWDNGRVHNETIYSVYGLANYFIPSKSDSVKEKARIKYKRLKFYPKGFNIYTKSNGITPPIEIEVTDEELEILLADCNLMFSQIKDIALTDENEKKRFLNRFLLQEYRKNDYSINPNSQPELSGKGKEVDE